MPKVSFIVPIYNAEKHLTKCLESLIAQNESDFEVLLIDDGSKDKSRVICDDFVKKDSRFKYFHQKNRGVSSARNVGISKASGEYIAFVDADDFIESHYVKFLYYTLKETKSDVCGFAMKFFNDSGASAILPINNKFSEVNDSNFLTHFCQDWLQQRRVHCVTKIYSREFLLSTNVKFNESLRYSEDRDFLFRLGVHARRSAWVPDALYNYYRHLDSATHAATSFDKVESMLRQYLHAYSNYTGYWEKFERERERERERTAS